MKSRALSSQSVAAILRSGGVLTPTFSGSWGVQMCTICVWANFF